MKTIQTFYNPANKQHKNVKGISATSLFTWLSCIFLLGLFWSGAAFVFEKDYVPHAIAKIEHKEKKFLKNHKAIQRKLIIIYSSMS